MAYEKKVPNWQEGGSEIPASKLTTGWQEAERPPANWFNRFFHTVAQAISELQEKAVEKTYFDTYIEALDTKKIDRANITHETGSSETLVMSQKGVMNAIDEVSGGALSGLDNKVDKSSIVEATGASSTLVMSQKATTVELNKKIDKDSIVSVTGQSTTSVASQNLVTSLNNKQTEALTNGLAGKIDKNSIVAETGDSTDTVMSQKAITSYLKTKVDVSNVEVAVSNSSSKVPSSLAVQNYVKENTPNISYGTVLPTSGSEGDIFILY